MKLPVTVLATAALLVAVFVLARFADFGDKPTEPSVATTALPVDSEARPGAGNAGSEKADTPFAVVETETAASTATAAAATGNSLVANNTSQVQTTVAAEDLPPVNAYEVGHEPLSEAELLELAERLRNDPNLLQQFMDEFRAESDPARLKRLSFLLGEIDAPVLTPLAEEMIYSGNQESRIAALDLLRRVQPRDPAARDVAINLLSSETDETVLIAALNVVAKPSNASEEQRQGLVNQVVPLIDHPQATVRRNSLSILSRWTKDESLTPVLLKGLSDSDPKVRQTATYALVDYPHVSEEAAQRLMDLAENPDEDKGVRRGAILALKGMPLDALTIERLEIAEQDAYKRPGQ